jgi:uncharacterized membrane protein
VLDGWGNNSLTSGLSVGRDGETTLTTLNSYITCVASPCLQAAGIINDHLHKPILSSHVHFLIFCCWLTAPCYLLVSMVAAIISGSMLHLVLVTLLVVKMVTSAHSFAVNSHSRHDKRELCSANQIFHGSWTYGKHGDVDEHFPDVNTEHEMVAVSYQHCPRTLNRLNSKTWLGLEYQAGDYSCDPRRTIPAQFEPNDCEIMHEHQAVAHIRQTLGHINSTANNQRPINVLFLGDSIGGQLFIALDCILQHKNLEHYVNITYFPEMLFRRDIPCEHNCTLPGEEGKKYRQEQMG